MFMRDTVFSKIDKMANKNDDMKSNYWGENGRRYAKMVDTTMDHDKGESVLVRRRTQCTEGSVATSAGILPTFLSYAKR